ncbi:MAG: arginine N-succinyltransferase [Parachlamydia sp.]|nr:arginine N-succinyltransferase [Parachlamydia sp.]
MHVIRPIRHTDFEAFVHMAQSASIGITNLPKNPDLLKKKLEDSLKAFAEERSTPSPDCYLFVLEHPETGVGGVAGLFSQTAVKVPEFFFMIEKISLPRFHPAVPAEMPLLLPVIEQNGPSEICSLFLAHNARKAGLGRLLSLSRFLFMAAFPQRFQETVTALMRGYFDAEGRSPFWEGVGRKFLDVDFLTLLRLREGSDEFVRNILPKYPMYAPLLSSEAQAAIGRVHPNTLPALTMLQHEGFIETGQIDFFDAGPRIKATSRNIRTVRESRVATVRAIVPSFQGEFYLICNSRLDFRAIIAPLILQDEGITQGITLGSDAAEALMVKTGDTIRYVTPR